MPAARQGEQGGKENKEDQIRTTTITAAARFPESAAGIPVICLIRTINNLFYPLVKTNKLSSIR